MGHRIGWFDAFRDNGAPTWYGDNRTPVVVDTGTLSIVTIFAIFLLAFFIILPGIRRQVRFFCTQFRGPGFSDRVACVYQSLKMDIVFANTPKVCTFCIKVDSFYLDCSNGVSGCMFGVMGCVWMEIPNPWYVGEVTTSVSAVCGQRATIRWPKSTSPRPLSIPG